METEMKEKPFLSPVEEPEGFGTKLTYYFIRKRYGKVLTPIKVFSSRLPAAFGLFFGKVSELEKELLLPPETVMLIREQVARLNDCLFSTDLNHWYRIQVSMNEAKFEALEDYPTSPLFSAEERAALDYAVELTEQKKVNAATFDRLAEFYSDRAICEIAWLVASEHLFNLTNLGLNIPSDRLCDASPKKAPGAKEVVKIVS